MSLLNTALMRRFTRNTNQGGKKRNDPNKDECKFSAVLGSPESCQNTQRTSQSSCEPSIHGRKKLGSVDNVTQRSETRLSFWFQITAIQRAQVPCFYHLQKPDHYGDVVRKPDKAAPS